MTREEAINIMLQMIKDEEEFLSDDTVEAHKMAIQALSQEPCVVDKATMPYVPVNKINNAPPVTQKPIECDDAISRDAALEKMADYVASGYADSAEDFLGYSRIICQLPSVTQKSGEWIKKEYWKSLPYDTEPLDYDNYDEKTHSEKVYHYYCSECDNDKGEFEPTDKFCPNCGAKMVEPQERDIEKRKPCINYEDGCEEWAGCPCVHYKAESEDK